MAMSGTLLNEVLKCRFYVAKGLRTQIRCVKHSLYTKSLVHSVYYVVRHRIAVPNTYHTDWNLIPWHWTFKVCDLNSSLYWIKLIQPPAIPFMPLYPRRFQESLKRLELVIICAWIRNAKPNNVRKKKLVLVLHLFTKATWMLTATPNLS